MLEEGMVEETQALLSKGFSETCPALSGLGYPRVIAYLKGQLSKEECLTLLIQDTRQYAKRQRTWFRHQLPVKWNCL
jgi:tRNA dimethylallyltransferase